MPYNFSLTVFTQRNFIANFLQVKCDFTHKMAILRFSAPRSPLGRLGATYDVHLRLKTKQWTLQHCKHHACYTETKWTQIIHDHKSNIPVPILVWASCDTVISLLSTSFLIITPFPSVYTQHVIHFHILNLWTALINSYQQGRIN